MDDQSKDFMAFITPFGKYRYTVMPFGITNGPPTYALLNSRVFKDQSLGDGNVMEIFFDDNGLGSSSFSGHMELLAKAFECYADAGMSLNPAKCLFFQKEITFLGHVLSEEGMRPEDEKMGRVRVWPTPQPLVELQCFLGFVNYYRRFVRDLQKLQVHCEAA